VNIFISDYEFTFRDKSLADYIPGNNCFENIDGHNSAAAVTEGRKLAACHFVGWTAIRVTDKLNECVHS